MFDHICSKSTAAATADALREFAGNHREALLSAANLLGGPDASRAAAEALEALASEKVPSRSTRRRFEALLELLSLENVHDETGEEAARFAAIDPGDPRVAHTAGASYRRRNRRGGRLTTASQRAAIAAGCQHGSATC
jgi:thioredoxin-like negative regulator of GroEL